MTSARFVVAAAVGAAVSTFTTAAVAHDITGWVSPSGIEVVEDQIPGFVPNPLPVPEITRRVTGCPVGDDSYVTQFDTNAVLTIHDTQITTPEPGIVRINLLFSLAADGNLRITGTCVPDTTCTDSATIDNARAIVDFAVGTDRGRPKLTLAGEPRLLAGEDDVDIRFGDCGIADNVANFVIGFAKEFFLGFILDQVEGLAKDKVGPMIEEMVAGFSSLEGSLLLIDYQAQLMSIAASDDGITIAAEADITSEASAGACIVDDPGDPAPHPADAPNLAAGARADLGVAVNLGLLNDVFYHVWRSGLLCLTDDTLRFYGVELPLDHMAGVMLPGFPPGADFSLDIHMASPPRVIGHDGESAVVTLVAEGLTVDLTGRATGGFEGKIHIEADLEATAEIGIDPAIGAITATVRGVEINRMEMEDQVGATELGFDVAGIQYMLEDVLLPSILTKMGEMPVTGSIFGFSNIYLVLREGYTTESHLVAKADLFGAPIDDENPPETAVTSEPEGWVSPANARLRLAGTDPELPGELLRYRVIVDNIARDPSFIREVAIGKAGVTHTYQVLVSAMDLAGNEDPSPISLEVKVDGIAPRATIVGDRVRKVTGNTATIDWKLSDDISAAADIVPTARVYRLDDHTNATDVTLIAEGELAPGTTTVAFDVTQGELYRVEVTARDAAGNTSVTSALVSTGSAGGCSMVTGAGRHPLAMLPLLFAAFALALMRYRRTPR